MLVVVKTKKCVCVVCVMVWFGAGRSHVWLKMSEERIKYRSSDK